jgi:hypothetical protein
VNHTRRSACRFQAGSAQSSSNADLLWLLHKIDVVIVNIVHIDQSHINHSGLQIVVADPNALVKSGLVNINRTVRAFLYRAVARLRVVSCVSIIGIQNVNFTTGV